MKFNEVFEEYMSLYTEAKKGLTGLALLAQQEQGEKVGRDGRGMGPDSKEDKEEETEDCESCGCSDEEVEDCETCGCEENPEYGHFDDKYSDYIDQYEAEEDGERVDKDRMR